MRARADSALFGVNLTTDNVAAFALRGLRHTDRAINFACCHIKTRFQTLIKIAQHAVGLVTRLGLAGDDKFIAARARNHTQTLFDAHEILIVLTV